MHLDTRATDVRPLRPRAKAKLVNLKELSIGLNGYLPQKFLQFKTAPFQLEKLRWTDCPNVDTLIVFLKTQTRLRRLEVELEDRCGWQQLPSQYCSELEYLKGNRAIVETILPGRKVSILDWDEVTRCCFEGESWPRSLVHLSEEFGNLKALRLLKWGDGSPFSYVLPQYLKNLQYIALSHEEPELFSIFSMLPCLVGVILPFHSAQKRDTGYLRTPSETGKLFRCSATLQFIDIQCRRAGIKMVNERWTASFDRREGCIQKELISSSIEEHMYL
ncbi:unnamed protein product [Cyclocybe aegerita]|uniref:Uncharacterized protein n=1 Tax=Cyclocybe aegerita TaxID=1973307 RepID=A0A8S0WD21_CYCAE|nr:unnamed protein product [Cyclocybe aegerita]